MKRSSWVVSREYSERPAREDGTCFYCKAKIGEEHNLGCVIRSKTVVVEARIQLIMTVPEDWDEEMIDFARNDGSWCASSLLYHDFKFADGHDGCLCRRTEVVYIREATEDDEQSLGVDWYPAHIKESQQKKEDHDV